MRVSRRSRPSLFSPPKDGTLRFNGKPGALANVKRGSILFGGRSDKTPVGLLRYVVEAKEEGGSLVLKTFNAPPQVAFRKMHLKANRDVPNFVPTAFSANPGIRPLAVGGGGDVLPIDMVLFDGDGNESTKDDQVKATGQLGGSLSYFFGWDFAWEEVLAELPAAVGTCLLEFASALIGENARRRLEGRQHVRPRLPVLHPEGRSGGRPLLGQALPRHPVGDRRRAER